MPFIPAICTNCGATLEVDNKKDAAICQYCGTPFVVEKAVNRYNNTYNIHGEVVNIFGDVNKDFVIRGGVLEKYNGEATEVIIPENVTAISDKVFAGLQISHITFPNSIESIGDGAFSDCKKLQNIQLPSKVKTLGNNCFGGCRSLRQVQLPPTLETLGASCFEGCESLSEITIPNTVKGLPAKCFYGCTSLKNIILSENLVSIDYLAFAGCTALESISLPTSIQHVADDYRSGDDYGILSSFAGCKNLNNVKLPFDPVKNNIAFRYNIGDRRVSERWAITEGFSSTPWYLELQELQKKAIDEALDNRQCPYCNSKLSVFFRKCKCCNKEYPK